MKEEKRECEEKIAAILNEFIKKYQPMDIDLFLCRTGNASGVVGVGVQIELKY